MKKILVTGATGFIGQYVIEQLLNMNCQVIATSSSSEKARTKSWFTKVKYIPLDFRHYDHIVNLFDYFDKPDLLIHLAWEGLPDYKAAFHLEQNLPGHFSFLKNLIDHGLKDLTITGTCLEYGMKEGCLSETTAPEPGNAYAIAKDNLRKQLELYQQVKPFTFRWVRLFYMFGKGQNPNSLLSQLEKALEEGKPVFNMSGGEQERDYLPVEEVAGNIVKISLQNKVTGIINCSSGQPIKIKDLVENYIDNRKKKISLNLGFYPYTDYEPMRFWGDNTKLKSIT